MPLLPPEPFVFPDDLLSCDHSPSEMPAAWWVLHTRPRAEKALARRFLNSSLPFFLPLYKREWRTQGRLLSSHLPLFPGYVFLYGDHQGRLQALETNLVVNCLPVSDQSRLRSDLIQVYQMMVCGSSLTPEDRLEPGAVVEITSGPLAGLQGKILRQRPGLRFFIEVDFLQRGVSVDMEGWMFRPVERLRPAYSGM
jgi:transcriptional antiterminator RfaH